MQYNVNMFSSYFKKYLMDPNTVKIACVLTLIAFALDIIFFFALSNSARDVSLYLMLALYIFLILGNWITNVMVPRGKLRKSVPAKYKAEKHKLKNDLTPREIAEIDYYAKGLSFSLWVLPSLIFTVVITLI